ncbi:MAG: hypothetical protein ABSF21_00175 [Dehalococcoidia bacterium]|jgi:hypothetical protein
MEIKRLTNEDIQKLRAGMIVYAAEDIHLIIGKVPIGTRGKISLVVRGSHFMGAHVTFDNGIKTTNPMPVNFLTREKSVKKEG